MFVFCASGDEQHRPRAIAKPRRDPNFDTVVVATAPAEDLPLPDQSLDLIVVTHSPCTIADAMAALRQVRRVLHLNGTLLSRHLSRTPRFFGFNTWRAATPT